MTAERYDEPRGFELTSHAVKRAEQEQVDPRAVIAALEEPHRERENYTGATDHWVQIDGDEFRVVATPGSKRVLTLHRGSPRDKQLRKELQELSRRTRSMERIDKRRRKR